jgi:hypothetical protein
MITVTEMVVCSNRLYSRLLCVNAVLFLGSFSCNMYILIQFVVCAPECFLLRHCLLVETGIVLMDARLTGATAVVGLVFVNSSDTI